MCGYCDSLRRCGFTVEIPPKAVQRGGRLRENPNGLASVVPPGLFFLFAYPALKRWA